MVLANHDSLEKKTPFKRFEIQLWWWKGFCSLHFWIAQRSREWSNNNIQFKNESTTTRICFRQCFNLEHQKMTSTRYRTKLEIMRVEARRNVDVIIIFPRIFLLYNLRVKYIKIPICLSYFSYFYSDFILRRKLLAQCERREMEKSCCCKITFSFHFLPISGIFLCSLFLRRINKANVGRNCDMVHQTSCLCSTNCKMIMFRILIIFESFHSQFEAAGKASIIANIVAAANFNLGDFPVDVHARNSKTKTAHH